jgi:peptidoglycan-N-acetylglucosamine deacetylase
VTETLHLLILAAVFAALPMAASAAANCGSDKLGTAREIEINGAEGLSVGLQSYPRSLDLKDHEVVLTFDDGPAEPTPQILEALKRECVQATFFLIGKNAKEMPHLVKREIEEGHTVGYHSMTHPDRTLRLMSLNDAKTDIDEGIAEVDKAAFGKVGEHPQPFFRFPGFADTPELLKYVHGRGMAVFGSDVWASDWRMMTPQEELKLVLERLEKEKKGIVLFHDNKPITAKMLPDFLRALKERGFKVVHLVPGSGETPVAEAGADWKSTTAPIVEKILKAKQREKHKKEAQEKTAPEKEQREGM